VKPEDEAEEEAVQDAQVDQKIRLDSDWIENTYR